MTFLGYEGCSVEAVIFLLLLTIIYTLGMQESNIFNIVFTSLKLLTLVAIVVVGYLNFNIDNYSPFLLEEKGHGP